MTGSAVFPPLAPEHARDGPRTGLEAVPPLVLAAAALVATGAAVYVTAHSRHAPNPVGHAALMVVVCLTFVGAGVVALRRPPYARFGLLLAAVGLSALLGALHDANTALPYTIGVLTANVVFALLVHALLAFPKGRLFSRTDRLIVVTAYANVLALQALAVLFDPLTRWNSDHPRNLALVDSHASVATALEELEAALAVAIALAVVTRLAQRAHAATPVARRQLAPVLFVGKASLLIFAAGLALAPLSSGAAVVGIGLGLLVSVALPIAFLGVILHGRLARAAVGELLVELREGGDAPDLQDALRRALGDSSLELARRDGGGRFVDGSGRAIARPAADDARVFTPILYQHEAIGALVHDRSLRLRPELLDAVGAAAGFALANERSLETVQRVEARNRALLEAIPDLILRVSRDGTNVDVRAEDPSGLIRPAAEQIGRNVREILPPDVAEAVLACLERALDTGVISTVEYELTIGGVARSFESRMVPSSAGEVVTIVRDFTDKRRAEVELRRLADEQAALRRVATLVAGDARPEDVFQAVTEEVCRLLGIPSALLERFEDDRHATLVGVFGEESEAGFEIGDTLPIEEGMASWTVLHRGKVGRVDGYEGIPGEVAGRMRAARFSSIVAVPITVAGATWGALVAALRGGKRLSTETELRLEQFAALVGMAVASAQARDELAASRRRIVEAGDAERRRLERNLHDGAQQRLVGLTVGLRLARRKLRHASAEADELLADTADQLSDAIADLRELAQGIHPAVLTDRGLGEALEVLAARAPIPVALDLRLPQRLPDAVEVAAYYVVSEALANVVKHSGASTARVRADGTSGCAEIEVADDGAGTANPAGSGLRGLRDRVETLDGRLHVASAPGHGTLVRAELPLHAPRSEDAFVRA